MFDKLQIRNFRRNTRLDVELEPVTVFVGPSGSGKSSLMGAFYWVCQNSPSGDNFIAWGHDYAAVRLSEKGRSVIRKRGDKDRNSYSLIGFLRLSHSFSKLGLPGIKVFKAFGTGVPQPIADFLNISDLNFQRQHAGPFWFSETAAEVSRRLNSIVNLELIDTTNANLREYQRNADFQIKDIKKRIEEATELKRELRYIVPIDKKLLALEKEEKTHQEQVKRSQVLSRLIQSALEYKEAAKQTVPNIKPLQKLHKQWKTQQSRIQQLDTLIKTAYYQEGERDVWVPDIKPLLKQHDEFIDHAVNKCNVLVDLISKAKRHVENIAEMDEELVSLRSKLTKLIGKRCPVCQSPIKS